MFKNSLVKIPIQKRSVIEWMVLLIIMLPFAFSGLNEVFMIPDVIRFAIDLFLIFILIALALKGYIIIHKNYAPLFFLIIVFFIYTLFVQIFNYQSIFYYVWGLRNNFRFYVAFFLFIMFLNESESDKYLKWFDIVFWINFFICIYQYFILGYNQDHLGGIFGVKTGCNAYLNLFFCITITKAIIDYLNKKEIVWILILKLVISIFVSALAELKFFFIELIVIVCVAVLVTAFTWRKFFIIIFSAIVLIVGIFALVNIFPEFVGLFTLEELLKSASSDSGYTSSGDINRLNAFAVISKNILITIPQKLFGFGLGNCDLSSISIFNTPFYERFSSLNYKWFSTSFWFLEGGYIGFGLFISFFVVCFILSLKLYKSGKARSDFCQISMVMCVVCLMSVIYNAALRLEIAYLVYFVLALPFISAKNTIETEETHPIIQDEITVLPDAS